MSNFELVALPKKVSPLSGKENVHVHTLEVYVYVLRKHKKEAHSS